jgi:5-methylcytosine-specific restriction endonuclease McrA
VGGPPTLTVGIWIGGSLGTGDAEGGGGAIGFGERLLALLDTGSFTTTYKYALLLSLIDAVLEGTGPDGSPPAALHGRDLGERVFALYWRQARPFSEAGPLRQSKQRDLVVKIGELRTVLGLAEHVSLDAARAAHPKAIRRLEREVVATVVRYPIPLLQRFGTGAGAVDDRFIYEIAWDDGVTESRVHRDDFDDRLVLVSGAGEHLAAIAGLARPVIEREWLRHVARRNAEHVDELRLETFLFGSPRTSLHLVREPLTDLQRGRCFYCRGERGPWEVDHFLPWARWPDDRLDNLVVAHARCNNDKRASLASLSHLERWRHRTVAPDTARRLDEVARTTGWPRHPTRTSAGARGLYLHQPPGTMLWAERGRVEPLDTHRLRALLADVGLAAEAGPGYDDR